MALPPPKKFAQDMPPPGGFPKVQIKQIEVRRGPAGFILVAGVLLGTAWGFYRHAQAMPDRQFQKLEAMAMNYERSVLISLRDAVKQSRLQAQSRDQEREAMKHIPGYFPSQNLYNTQPTLIPTHLRPK